MAVASKEKAEGRAKAPPGAIESATWWQPSPGVIAGIASIGGVFGALPYNRRRFDPGIDAVLLHRDGAFVMRQLKHWRKRAEAEDPQQHLFDPDA